jgi:hypothetical protein
MSYTYTRKERSSSIAASVRFGLSKKLLAESMERFCKHLVVEPEKPVLVQRVAYTQRIPEHALGLSKIIFMLKSVLCQQYGPCLATLSQEINRLGSVGERRICSVPSAYMPEGVVQIRVVAQTQG